MIVTTFVIWNKKTVEKLNFENKQQQIMIQTSFAITNVIFKLTKLYFTSPSFINSFDDATFYESAFMHQPHTVWVFLWIPVFILYKIIKAINN